MYRNLDCIALRTIRYSDRNSILSVYTRQAGRMSLLVPAGTGKTAARLRALLMPLGRFDCVADIRNGRDIHPFRDVRPVVLPPVSDPLRSSVAMFVTDLLSGLLREAQEDAPLFAYMDYALRLLAATPRVGALRHEPGPAGRPAGNPPATLPPFSPLSSAALSNFHICFMVGLSRFLGIEPDWGSYLPGSVLDLAGGVFLAAPPPHRRFLPTGESAAAYALGRMTFRNMGRYRFSRFERNMVLDRMLLYYQTHYPSLTEPSSLAILRMMAD